jgi:hypothetical protein
VIKAGKVVSILAIFKFTKCQLHYYLYKYTLSVTAYAKPGDHKDMFEAPDDEVSVKCCKED